MEKTIIKSIRFLGTGPSSGVPNLSCLATTKCQNCMNKNNKRTCVSLLIRTNKTPILIDCTKSFYEQYSRFLKEKNENEEFLPTVLLTHSHADAILGLDFLMQMIPKDRNLPLYCDNETMDYLEDNYEYLLSTNANKKGLFNGERLKMNEMNIINGVDIKAYHVIHGDGNSVAYYIDNNILYVSDCSYFDLDIKPKVLIIDCTTYNDYAFGHMNFLDVLEVIEKTKPDRTYLVGMSHKVDRDILQEMANKYPYNITVAFDDMEIEYSEIMYDSITINIMGQYNL